MKAFIFIGLPGAGKSTLAKRIQYSLGGELLDDIKSPNDLVAPIKRGNNLFITSPEFVTKIARDNLLWKFCNTDYVLKWYFFENSVDKCWKNVLNRKDGRKISLYTIMSYSGKYEIETPILKVKEDKQGFYLNEI